MDKMGEIVERIPSNTTDLMKNIKDMQSTLYSKKIDDGARFAQLEADTTMLKKKQNLSELEHRVCDRIDEVARAMTRTMAEKFDTSKRFRLVENRLHCLMEILVMSSSSETEDKLKKIFNGLIKGSKKLKNPSALLLHTRAQIAQLAKLEGNEYQS